MPACCEAHVCEQVGDVGLAVGVAESVDRKCSWNPKFNLRFKRMETSSAIVLPRLRPLLAKDLVSSLLSTFFEMGMLRKVSLDGDATMEWGGRPWNPTVPMVNCVHLIIR